MLRPRALALALALAVVGLAACGAGTVGDDDDDDDDADAGAGLDGAPADAGEPGALLGPFELTYYWVTSEAEFAGAQDTDLFDTDCNVAATVRANFADSISIEGTGRTLDGRLLNVDGACACAFSPCFYEPGPDFPWGVGAQDNSLIPFRSVAVDPDVIELGTPLWVAVLDGVTMPGDPDYGDFVHDGCVFADDVGGGIVGAHIDFFAALFAHYDILDGELGLNEVTLHAGGGRCLPRE
jgi:3D (Asp-Asp-Asp) domain-containing protein